MLGVIGTYKYDFPSFSFISNNNFFIPFPTELNIISLKGEVIRRTVGSFYYGGCSIMAVRTVVVREERVRFPPSALNFVFKETLLNSRNLSLLIEEEKMKIQRVEIKPFKFGDYIRFLKVRLSPKTRKEFARSVLGYFIVALKDFSSKIKVYKFSIYSNDRLAGCGAIFNERGFDEMEIFVLPEYRRKGIATEATKWLLKYCFNDLRYKKINAVTNKLSFASEGILKNLGFKLLKKGRKNDARIWEKKNKTSSPPKLGRSREKKK